MRVARDAPVMHYSEKTSVHVDDEVSSLGRFGCLVSARCVAVVFHSVPFGNRRSVSTRHRVLQLIRISVAVFLVSSAAAADCDRCSAATPPSKVISDLAAQRFEVGWRIGLSPSGQYWLGGPRS